MKAVLVTGSGEHPADLALVDVPKPELEQGFALVRTRFAGVNRPDILQRRGLYPPPQGASPILGLEVSGTIESIHPATPYGTAFKIGDEVCALVNGGGYAEYVAVDIRHLLPVPTGLSLQAAGALPETVLTVYANLMEHGALKAGETILVHGANSGIGSMTVQMGKAFGAKVIATARGADKCAFAAGLGADLVIDTEPGDFVGPVKDFGGADVVLDIIAGDFAPKNLLCLNTKGRIVQVGTSRTAEVQIDLRRIMQKQAILTGSMLRPRSPDEKARLTQAVRERVWPLVEAGRIKAVIDRVFDFSDVAAAQAYMDSGTHKGKVILKL